MPTYEYCCDTCDSIFEEIFIELSEAREYQNAHPCPQCDSIARRILSSTNFQFSGTPGHSGSHDLDYPTLDKAVGRSASEKWKKIHEDKAKRDKVRKEAGQYAVTQIGDQIVPTSSDKLKIRDSAAKTLSAAMKKADKA